jgi:hypothetical protein
LSRASTRRARSESPEGNRRTGRVSIPMKAPHHLHDLGRSDEAAVCGLGEYDDAVHGNVKDPMGPFDELRGDPKAGFKGSCHTDSAREVVSRCAVGYGNSHKRASSGKRKTGSNALEPFMELPGLGGLIRLRLVPTLVEQHHPVALLLAVLEEADLAPETAICTFTRLI